MRHQGKLIEWNDKKGYGFVVPSGGGDRVFAHIKSFASGTKRPVNGDVIFYEIEKQNNGKIRAVNVAFRKSNNFLKGMGVSILICAAIPLAYFAVRNSSITFTTSTVYLLGFYGLMSLITFLAYAIDKSAAKNNRWRTKESTLHVLSFAGGWPGAFVAQSVLRHKSKKAKFKAVFWLTVLLNLVVLFYIVYGYDVNYLDMAQKYL